MIIQKNKSKRTPIYLDPLEKIRSDCQLFDSYIGIYNQINPCSHISTHNQTSACSQIRICKQSMNVNQHSEQSDHPFIDLNRNRLFDSKIHFKQGQTTVVSDSEPQQSTLNLSVILQLKSNLNLLLISRFQSVLNHSTFLGQSLIQSGYIHRYTHSEPVSSFLNRVYQGVNQRFFFSSLVLVILLVLFNFFWMSIFLIYIPLCMCMTHFSFPLVYNRRKKFIQDRYLDKQRQSRLWTQLNQIWISPLKTQLSLLILTIKGYLINQDGGRLTKGDPFYGCSSI
jgi:hypothetical protein